MTNENEDIVFLTNTKLNNRVSHKLAHFFLCSFQFRHARPYAFSLKKIVGQFTYPNKQ